MFRDLKEYQEIAKIYADKVSKPENLEERRGANLSQDQIAANRKGLVNRVLTGNPEGKRPDMSGSNKRAENARKRREMLDKNKPKSREEVGLKNNVVKKPSPFERKFGAERNQQRLKQSGLSTPSTAEIRAKNPDVVPGTRTNEVGAQGGGKPSSGDLSMFKDKKPEVSTMTKQGKPRTKAQMMAAKRIASGKTIDDVKKSNTDAMRARAKEKFAAFKAKRLEKKIDKQRDFDDPNKKMNRGESYTPYDIVLEYLLSSEQAATIEEANYIMTEMDAETIQSIVSN